MERRWHVKIFLSFFSGTAMSGEKRRVKIYSSSLRQYGVGGVREREARPPPHAIETLILEG